MRKVYYGIFLVFLCTIGNAFGQFFIKKGTENLNLSFALVYNYNLLLGLFLYAISAFILVIALRYGELSVLYPIISLTFIWVAILSSYSLDEIITETQLAGIGLIIFGTITLNIKK